MNTQIKVGTIPAIQPIILPKPGILSNRSNQFDKLNALYADNHALVAFWRALCAAQNATLPQVPISQVAATEPFLLPSLNAETFIPVLQALINTMDKTQLNSATLAALSTIATTSDTTLMTHAQGFMTFDETMCPNTIKPFIGAALQTFFYAQAQALDLNALPNLQGKAYKHRCPLCSMPPLASTIDPAHSGLRYLTCSLCETQWHYVRSKCHQCDNNDPLELISLDGADLPMTSECCKDCMGYIKHIDRSKNPLLDLFVEDIASIKLDFALAEEGYHRASQNFYLA